MQDGLSSEVIVLKSDGEMLGKMGFRKAQDLAREAGLDLVQVSKRGGLSVCKIIDQGKWLFDQKKKAKKAKKQQSQTHHLKEIKFGMRIDEHDQVVKIAHIQKFFEKGFDVRVVVEMRGRERAHPELAAAKLDKMLSHLECDLQPSSRQKSPRHVSAIVKPRKTDGKHASEAKDQTNQDKPAHSDRQREAG